MTRRSGDGVRGRRRVLQAVAVSMGLGIAGCSSPDITGTDGTPNSEPESEGSPPASTPESDSTPEPESDGGEARWQFDPETRAAEVYQPVAGSGAVFLSVGGNTVHAIDPGSGESTGTTNVAGAKGGIVRGDRLYVPGNNELLATTADGSFEEHWRLEEEGMVFRGVRETAESVFAMRWDNFGQTDDQSPNSVLHCLDPSDGSRKWTNEYYEPAVTLIDAGGGAVYVGGERLRALDPEDGSETWTFEHGNTNAVAGVLDDETLFVGTGGRTGGGKLFAVDTTDGTDRWNVDYDGPGVGPLVDEERLYVGAGGLWAYDRSDGSESWSTDVGVAAPALGDGTVYAVVDRETLYALEATTGDERWSIESDAGFVGRPTAGDGVVCVRDENGVLRAFAAE